MAIVSDPFDPSGMFSKAGRVSLEMFQLIQQKDEILFNQKKYYKPKMASFGLYNMVFVFLNSSSYFKKESLKAASEFKEKDLPGQNKEKKAKVLQQRPIFTKSRTLLKMEPFAKIVSREQANQILSKEKHNDKRFGMYHPRYNLVFKLFLFFH